MLLTATREGKELVLRITATRPEHPIYAQGQAVHPFPMAARIDAKSVRMVAVESLVKELAAQRKKNSAKTRRGGQGS